MDVVRHVDDELFISACRSADGTLLISYFVLRHRFGSLRHGSMKIHSATFWKHLLLFKALWGSTLVSGNNDVMVHPADDDVTKNASVCTAQFTRADSMKVRFANLLEHLLEAIPTNLDEGASSSARNSLAIRDLPLQSLTPNDDDASPDIPAFSTEGIIANPLPIVVGMIREFDLTPLAGIVTNVELDDSASERPHFVRSFRYRSILPWPFSPRDFSLKSWFLSPNDIPERIKQKANENGRGQSVVYLSESTPVPDIQDDDEGVVGQVLLSAYLFVPITKNQTWLRRVISVNLNWSMPLFIEIPSLRSVYQENHEWMNDGVNTTTIAAIEERLKSDNNNDLYQSLVAQITP